MPLKARRGLEATLGALRAVRDDPSAPASLTILREALTGRSNLAAGKAAQITGQHQLAGLAPELVAAFDRFLQNPAEDPACAAKSAIADALYQLGHEDPAVFLRGIRCVQMEPSYAERDGLPRHVDTAIDVRGSCAFGLARSGYRQALLELAELLTDKEAPARASAARAIAYRADACAVPLLRFKVRSGDADASVLAECFLALLKIDARGSLEFVARHLDEEEPVAGAAGVALGESRLPQAFVPLRDWCRRLSGTREEGAALLALATLRHDEAFHELLSVVRTGSERSACRALEALGTGRGDATLTRRVREACATRDEATIGQAFKRAFPPD